MAELNKQQSQLWNALCAVIIRLKNMEKLARAVNATTVQFANRLSPKLLIPSTIADRLILKRERNKKVVIITFFRKQILIENSLG